MDKTFVHCTTSVVKRVVELGPDCSIKFMFFLKMRLQMVGPLGSGLDDSDRYVGMVAASGEIILYISFST